MSVLCTNFPHSQKRLETEMRQKHGPQLNTTHIRQVAIIQLKADVRNLEFELKFGAVKTCAGSSRHRT